MAGFFRAIGPWQDRPFLSLLQSAGVLKAADSNVPTILDRCIVLELRAKRIYAALAKAFSDEGLAGPFFAGLADQEQYHADLLEICRAIAVRSGWKAALFNPWQDYLPRLEKQMDAAKAAIREVGSLDEALRLVVKIESRRSTRCSMRHWQPRTAAFVKKLRTFGEGDGSPHEPTSSSGFQSYLPS